MLLQLIIVMTMMIICHQGKFIQCRAGGGSPTIHYFHEGCQVFENNKNHCPHCGMETDMDAIHTVPTEPPPLPCVTRDLNFFKSLRYYSYAVCLISAVLRHVRIAESEPYCHSILFVCLSVCRSFGDLQPTTIDRSQPPVLGPV